MKTYKPAVLSQNVMQSVTYLAERERGFFYFPEIEYAKDEKLKPFPQSVLLWRERMVCGFPCNPTTSWSVSRVSQNQ